MDYIWKMREIADKLESEIRAEKARAAAYIELNPQSAAVKRERTMQADMYIAGLMFAARILNAEIRQAREEGRN